MLKILHTGDLHLGRQYLKYAQENPEVAKRYQDARLQALDNVIKLANENNCDYLVIAGDLFDTHSAPRKLMETVCKALEKCICPILILPGNHDYCESEDTFWSHFKDISSERVSLLDKCKPFERDDAVFYPCPCNDRRSATNALAWLRDYLERSADLPNIGIAHGALENLSCDVEQRYYYMTLQELESLNMDLWLIGHTHMPYPAAETAQNCRIFNAGTHQQTDIADNSEGSVFLITLDDQKNVNATRLPTGVIRFARIKHVLEHGASLPEFLASLKDAYDAANTSIRLYLSGIALADDYEQRQELYKQAENDFLRLEVLDYELQKEITREMIDSETLEGSIENELLKRYLNDPGLLNLAYSLIKACREAK